MKHVKCGTRACATKMDETVRANKKCMRAVCANHDAHGNILTSRVYTRALNMHFYHCFFVHTQAFLRVFTETCRVV